jgi:hypothetical protein
LEPELHRFTAPVQNSKYLTAFNLLKKTQYGIAIIFNACNVFNRVKNNNFRFINKFAMLEKSRIENICIFKTKKDTQPQYCNFRGFEFKMAMYICRKELAMNRESEKYSKSEWATMLI